MQIPANKPVSEAGLTINIPRRDDINQNRQTLDEVYLEMILI